MFAWLSANLPTILICLVLAAVVAAVIIKLVRDHKKGKHACGCECSHCAMCDSCRKQP